MATYSNGERVVSSTYGDWSVAGRRLEAIRAADILYTYGAASLPTNAAGTGVGQTTTTLSWNGWTDATTPPSRVDRFILHQDYTLTNESRLIYPPVGVTQRNIIVGVFAGHANASYSIVTYGYLALTQALLAAGYHVLAVDMPVCGMNPTVPAVTIQGVSRALVDHPTIFLYCEPAPESYKCLKLFQEGYIHAINSAAAVLPTARFAAMGHSGGAFQGSWATAMDPRIERFFGCGGTLPYDVMASNDGWYDDEDKPGTRPYLQAAGRTYEDVFATAAYGWTSSGRTREVWYMHNDNDNNWGLVSVAGRQALWTTATNGIITALGSDAAGFFRSIVYQGTPVTHDITTNMRTQILARLAAM